MSKAKLFQKFLAVQKELQPLAKNGRNDFHHYSYTTAFDTLDPIREACNAQGLVVFSSVIESQTSPGRAWVTVCLSVADPESGESITINAPGYAEDFSYKENRPTGDKQLAKAITSAHKYAFRTLFCLPSADDPEKPSQNDIEQAKNVSTRPQPNSRASKEVSREEWLARKSGN